MRSVATNFKNAHFIILWGILLLNLCSFSASATWYQSSGSAAAANKNDQQARSQALQSAVYQTIVHAGGNISQFPNLIGVLSQKKQSYYFSGSEVRTVAVIDEKFDDNVYTIQVKVDIYVSANACHKQQYKKGILLGSLKIAYREQANMGNIYRIGEDFTETLKSRIQAQGQSFNVTAITKVKFNEQDADRIRMLAQDHQAQYLLTGKITDLTTTQTKVGLLKNKTQLNRQFAFELSLFDGSSGDLLYQRNYRNIAHWPFDKISQVDTRSARFWESTYGAMIQGLSRQAMLDLEAELACRATLSEVIAVTNNIVQINMGRDNGVKQGDTLSLWHKATFFDYNGQSQKRTTNSKLKLTVSRVYDKRAELTSNNRNLTSSIQVGDLLTRGAIKNNR